MFLRFIIYRILYIFSSYVIRSLEDILCFQYFFISKILIVRLYIWFSYTTNPELNR